MEQKGTPPEGKIEYKNVGVEVNVVDDKDQKWFGDNGGVLSPIPTLPEITVTPDNNFFGSGGGPGIAEDRDGGGNNLSLPIALAGINGMIGLFNSQSKFNYDNLTNAQRNKNAFNIQKGLKANGERILTKEIKTGIKAGFKNTSRKLGIVGFVFIGANIYDNGGVKPSDVVNGIVTGIGMTGWGAPIAAGYFIIDIGVSVFNNGQGLSDLIDNQLGY